MSRRIAIAVVLLVAPVLALAAAAQPVRLWVAPASGAEVSPADGAAPVAIDSPRQPEEQSESLGGFGPLAQLLAVLVTAAGAAALVAMRGWWPDGWTLGGAHPRRRRMFGSLPEVPDDTRTLDVEEARGALSTGSPRNAIVECWMRLESDIAASGWPRSDAETSAEYVERIIAELSVDPSAISDLAALYREARFSAHPLVDTDRTDALAALSRIDTDLRSRQKSSA